MNNSINQNNKDIWISIFRRKGGDGAWVQIFDNLDKNKKGIFLSKFILEEGELPVISGFKDEDNWALLTTKRLIWFYDDEYFQIDVKSIRNATVDFGYLQSEGIQKIDMSTLQVKTIEGNEYSIELESGPPLIGIWSILQHLGTKNQNRN